MIDAAGGTELDAALAQLAGGLAAPLHQLRDDLVELLAHLEAGFDFADEDLPFITAEELLRQLEGATAHVERLVEKLALRGEAVADVRVVLVGRPNAGKSSLFNALSGRNKAIVSAQAGTTRDYLTAELDLDGVKCQLIDMAGIEGAAGEGEEGEERGEGEKGRGGEGEKGEGQEVETLGPVGNQGRPAVGWTSESVPQEAGAEAVAAAAQTMAHEQLRMAHVRVLCVEQGAGSTERLSGKLPSPDQPTVGARRGAGGEGGSRSRVAKSGRIGTDAPLPGPLPEGEGDQFAAFRIASEQIVVLTKCDQAAASPAHPREFLETSAVTGLGIGKLKEAIRAAVLRAAGPQAEVVIGTALRCGQSLRLAAASLQRAQEAARGGLGEEFVAAEIRIALTELGKVAGAVYSEDLLDRIFSRFCIGK